MELQHQTVPPLKDCPTIHRLRCYSAALQGTELPNPQTLLASVSKPTKISLGRVGVFSVSALHAIVSGCGCGCG